MNQPKLKGVTLTTDWNINDYLFGLSYDYQKAKNESGKNRANDGNYLPIRPENKGMVYVGYQLDDLDIRLQNINTLMIITTMLLIAILIKLKTMAYLILAATIS